jgi:S1-C subfamily serine protease
LLAALVDSVEAGVQVDSVVPGGLAERSGLVTGDQILEMDGRPIGNQEQFEAALDRACRAARPAVVRVDRAGDRWYLALATPES